MKPDKPAAQRCALPIPNDPLDAVLGSLGGMYLHEKWFDDMCYVDLDLENDNIADDFLLETLETLEPDTTVVTNAAEPASKPSGRPAATSLSSAPPSSSSEDEEDDGEPWLPRKSKKRRVCDAGTARRPQQKRQRAPTGQRKRKLEFTVPSPSPVLAVVVLEGEKRCRDCGTTETMQWRAGPDGPKTLCNACGLRWKKQLAPSAEHRPPPKPTSHAKNKNNSALSVAGDGNVARKQRGAIIYID